MHEPEDRVHALEEKSQIPVVDQVTFPVGDEPVTVTVQMVDVLMATDEGVQLTEVTELMEVVGVTLAVSDDGEYM